jgi:NDP-sugar pyrophosphorylase family protein
MKAMIFAAGLGTRLRPLTDERPKALINVGGMPLLEIAIRRLKYFGCRDILINIHHFGQQVLDFLEGRQYFGINIQVSDERAKLLDTGGGLKKASWFFQAEPFLIHNADIISDIDLGALYEAHRQSSALATLAVRQRPSSRCLLFDAGGRLAGWRHTAEGRERICREAAVYTPLAFSGIYALSPAIFQYMPEGEEAFSIIDVFLAAGQHERIMAYRHDDSLWLDVGKPAALEQAQILINSIPLA